MGREEPTSDFWLRLTSFPYYAHMNQEEIGKVAGKGQTAANKWKLGTSNPTLANAKKLAAKVGCCVEWLLTGEGPVMVPAKDAFADRLWQLWPCLDESAKDHLVGIAIGRATRNSDDCPQTVAIPAKR